MNSEDRYFVAYKNHRRSQSSFLGVVTSSFDTATGKSYEVELITGRKVTATSQDIVIVPNQKLVMLEMFDYFKNHVNPKELTGWGK